MKILELQLLAYGPFTDTVLDFSGAGFQIVYGPNEAGKSSTLRSIHGLLFGIPTRCPDNHVHEYKKLRIGGTIATAGTEELTFVRRKATKGSILNPKHKQGAAFPDDVLKPFLHGIDGDTFQRVYGIGHEELRRGGDDMRALKGLVGESLFAATIGGKGLVEALAQLESEADEFFSTSKRTASVKVTEKQYRELQKQKRESRLSANEWTKLQAELKHALDQRDEIAAQSQALKRQLNHLQRIQQALGIIGRRKQAISRLEELHASVVLPSTYDAAHRLQIESELKRASEQLAAWEPLLDGPESIESKVAAIEIPDGLLEFTDAIAELQDQRAVHVKAQADKRALVRDVENAQMQVSELMRDLGLPDAVDEIESFRLTADARFRINAMSHDEKMLRTRPMKLKHDIDVCTQFIAQTQETLEGQAEPSDIALLVSAVDDVVQMGNPEELHEAARTAFDRSLANAERMLAQEPIWNGVLADVCSVAVPNPETIRRFSKAAEAIASEHAALEKELRQFERSLAKTNEFIAALENKGHVPSEQELDELRADRDLQWRTMRDEMTITADSASSYEAAVDNADLLADRLRRETERVTQLAQRRAEAESLQENIDRTKKEIKSQSARQSQLDEQWSREWSDVDLSRLLPPEEMRAWVADFAELQRAAEDVAERKSEVERTGQRVESAKQRIYEALQDVDGGGDFSDWSLARLLDYARTHVQQQQAIAAEQEELRRDIAKRKSELREVERALNSAYAELDVWQYEWAPAMKKLGLEPSASAEQANLRVEQIQKIFDVVAEIASKQKRIRDIDADSELFEQNASLLAERFLPPTRRGVEGAGADELALLLKSRLDQAQQDHATLARLQTQLAETRTEAEATRNLMDDLQCQLDVLLNLAGTDDSSDLAQIERDSQEKRTWQQRLDELNEQLHELCGSNDVAEFVQEANESNHDDVSVQISETEQQLSSLERERDDAVANVSELQSRADAADGSERVAELDQESLGLISRMHKDASSYMKRRLAHQILRRHIEAHRAENEDPLLQRASELFARLTCGEFAGIRTDYDGDHPVIVGIRQATSDLIHVAAMSDGTRDQLYLALRLAYVEKQLADHEPMPFIVDDILVHFDDARSQATLEVLAELSKKTQVIFFTHHLHLTELAKNCLAKDQLTIQNLTAPAAADVSGAA
ncbi:MAG: AAA family ATPase [Planctomycetales bacterium]|nr:AAA family ATPase [Planctomycetales bacterium]